MSGGTAAGPPEERGERPEMAILIGLQASGKSTFYRQRLAGRYVQVSKDAMRRAAGRQKRQLRMLRLLLAEGRNVAVDNTNPSPEEWRPLIELARRHGARVVGYWFPPDVPGTVARNAARPAETRVPEVGIYATLKRLRWPRRADGFDELLVVRFDGAGGFTVRDEGIGDEGLGGEGTAHGGQGP